MKVLDEKGRLFGKINLIDLLVILLVLAVIAAVVWKMGGQEIGEAVAGGNPKYRVEVLCADVNPTVCDYVLAHPGGQLMSKSGDMLNGYIVDCTLEPQMEFAVDGEGNPVQAEDTSLHHLRFIFETELSKTGASYSLGDQEVRVGRALLVRTNEIEITGRIMSMEPVDDNG